jgi:trimethylamine--corrinoid protein Co-methyltransferase
MIDMMRHFVSGISLDAEHLAMNVIHHVGPGGEFLSTDHTLAHFRDFWEPKLFNRERAEDWIEAGRKSLGDRLREKTVQILDEHEPEPLPAGTKEEIDYVLASG